MTTSEGGMQEAVLVSDGVSLTWETTSEVFTVPVTSVLSVKVQCEP